MKLRRLLAVVLMLALLFVDAAQAEDNNKYYAKATADVMVYHSAKTSSTELGKLQKDTFVLMEKVDSEWAKVTLNGKTGYCKLSKLKKTARSMYVESGTAVIYKKANSDSAKLTTLAFGTKVAAYYVTGSYTHVVYGKYEGWTKASNLDTSDPNTMNTTVYYQGESGKLYSAPSTSASSSNVSGTTKLTCTAVYDGSWCRVKTGSGSIGFIQKSKLGTTKYSAKSSASSSSSSSKSSSASSESSATGTRYVNTGSVYVFKKADAGSTKLGVLAYGAKVSVSETSGSYSKITSGSLSGYCKTSSLSSTNPNTLNSKVYPQTKGVKVYETPSSSASSATLSSLGALTCTAIYDGTWCRVTVNGKVGFIKKSDLGTKKYDGYSTATPASGTPKEMDWFSSRIQSIFAKGTTAVVTDVKSGISWKVKRSGGYNHADVQPLTAADTAAMKKACGSDFGTWHRRAITVSINGQKYAASMNCMPHGNGNITDNNFDGHHCIHFTNSRTHETNKVDSDHQAAIKYALAHG